VLRRASELPTLPYTRSCLRICGGTPHARTKQTQASTPSPFRWVTPFCCDRTKNAQTRLHHALCPAPELANMVPPATTQATARARRCGSHISYVPPHIHRPNKPKPPHPSLPDGSQHAAVTRHKMRRRTSTVPSAPHQHGASSNDPLKASARARHKLRLTSPTPSVGSGSFGYPPPSESEA